MTAIKDLPPLGPVRFVTVHCTATPEGRPNTAAEVTSWDIARFGRPSYHYTIELDGLVVNTLPIGKKGAHTGGANTGNIGISYVGGTTTLNAGAKPKDTRTKAQKVSLRRLVLELQAKYPKIIIRGHNEWPHVAKACPSFSMTGWLQAGMPT